MKKLLLLLVLSGLLLPAEAMAYSHASSAPTVKEMSFGKRKKARGYRKKKGFMWGLFRKNDCGCPNH